MILALQIVSNTAQFWQLPWVEKLTSALALNEKQDWWLKVVIHMKRLSTKVGNFSNRDYWEGIRRLSRN